MLEYERIDISEEIDVNKTNLLKECVIIGTYLSLLVF